MKTIYRISIFFMLIALTSTTCTDEEDPCDESARSEKQVTIKATVHVLTMDDEPIANEQVQLSIYKSPCGAPAKGFFDFNGPTSEAGTWQSSVCGYNLRNLDDEVVVDVFVPNLGNGSAEANSEYAYYKYDDFLSTSTKEVHIYVYKKD